MSSAFFQGPKDKNKMKVSASLSTKVTVSDESIDFKIAASRPPTDIGSQGDHVSAYALFKECLYTRFNGLKNIEKSFEIVLGILDRYTDDKTAGVIFKQTIEKLSQIAFISNLEAEKAISILKESGEQKLADKISVAIELSNQALFEKGLAELIETHITLRNKLKYTAMPSECSVAPPKGEGARVRKAIKYLGETEKLSSLPLAKVVSHIKLLFWYPRLPENKIFNLEDEKSKEKWEKIVKKKNYRTGTKPRTNDLDQLCEVVENHLEWIFLCYPWMEGNYQKDIINDFLKFVIRDNQTEDESGIQYGWELKNSLEQKAISLTVRWNLIKFRHLGENSDVYSRAPMDDDREPDEVLMTQTQDKLNLGILSGKMLTEKDDDDMHDESFEMKGKASSATRTSRASSGERSNSGSQPDEELEAFQFSTEKRVAYSEIFKELQQAYEESEKSTMVIDKGVH